MPIPSWVPPELHEIASKNPQMVEDEDNIYNGPEAEKYRGVAIKVLTDLNRKKDWLSLDDLRRGRRIGPFKPIPPEQIAEIFDLDGQKHHYGAQWQEAAANHRDFKVTPEQAEQIYANPDMRGGETSSVAGLVHSRLGGPLPKQFNVGMALAYKKPQDYSDEDLADLVSRSNGFDVNWLMRNVDISRNYDDSAPNNAFWQSKPKLAAAIRAHPEAKDGGWHSKLIRAGAATTDDEFEQAIAGADLSEIYRLANSDLPTAQADKVLNRAIGLDVSENPKHHEEVVAHLLLNPKISDGAKIAALQTPKGATSLEGHLQDAYDFKVDEHFSPEVIRQTFPYVSKWPGSSVLDSWISSKATDAATLKTHLDSMQGAEMASTTMEAFFKNPNVTSEIAGSMWDSIKKSPEASQNRQKRAFATEALAANAPLDHNIKSEILDSTPVNQIRWGYKKTAKALEKHHPQLVDKIKSTIGAERPNDYQSASNRISAEDLAQNLAQETKDPQVVRELVGVSLRAPIGARENPITPSDLLVQMGQKDPQSNRIFSHQNYPEDKLKEHAADPEHPQTFHAKELLDWRNPDSKYESPWKGRADLDYGPEDFKVKGVGYGSVGVKQLDKLRVFRDKILAADPVAGQVKPKDLGTGPFDGGWKPVQEKNGNISAKKLQDLIDSSPSTKFNFSHQLWSPGVQTHSNKTQRVFKLNVTNDHVKQMRDAGVYDTFKTLTRHSSGSGHPADEGHTIGWVRYEHHDDVRGTDINYTTDSTKPKAIHVDEIQTDMGENTLAQLRQAPDKARNLGVDPDHLEKVQKIVFGNKHPSDVLLAAFRQHHRDQGRHDVPIHLMGSAIKAQHSGMNSEKTLPAHMQHTYEQMPKKLGFSRTAYGATPQQDNPVHANKPTWVDPVRKSEDALIKAIADIKPGKSVRGLPQAKKDKLPINVYRSADLGGYLNDHIDYNHVLTPQHKRAGYQLFVKHYPGSSINATLYHKGHEIGGASGSINMFAPDRLHIESVAIGDDPKKPKHQGKGLGKAMYEALLAHAYHTGIRQVKGASHSTMAHRAHQSLAQKHGLDYKAVPNYMPTSSDQQWPDRASWESAMTGPFDSKYGPYQFVIKSEGSMGNFRAAGFRDEKGIIYETGTSHNPDLLPPEVQDKLDLLEQGFVTHKGTFLTRGQAAAYVGRPMEIDTNVRRDLDSHDAEAFGLHKSEDGIVAMLHHNDPTERVLALKSALVRPEHLVSAITDVDPTVRAETAKHPLINAPLLMELLRTVTDPETARALLAHESCGDEHVNYALETHPEWLDPNGGQIEEFEDDDLWTEMKYRRLAEQEARGKVNEPHDT